MVSQNGIEHVGQRADRLSLHARIWIESARDVEEYETALVATDVGQNPHGVHAAVYAEAMVASGIFHRLQARRADPLDRDLGVNSLDVAR